jgi:protein-S-isoprenylcysteine O-methyltransferase Ste14
MIMESLLKVLLILSSAIALHVSFTTENVPSNKEVVRQTFNEWIFTRLVKYAFPTIKAFYWVVSFAEIAIIVLHLTDPDSVPIIRDTPINFPFIFGTALAITGGLIRWWCYRTLGRFFTFQLSIREGQHIVTTGPYAVIRHPAYTAGMVEIFGILIVHGSTNSWLRCSGVLDIPGLKVIVAMWLAEITLLMTSVMFRVSQEDQVLKSAFRSEWEKWAEAVRYRLIPGIY